MKKSKKLPKKLRRKGPGYIVSWELGGVFRVYLTDISCEGMDLTTQIAKARMFRQLDSACWEKGRGNVLMLRQGARVRGEIYKVFDGPMRRVTDGFEK
jgi:hypothetical protein